MEIVLPPSDTRLVGPYGRVGRCGEEKISAPVGNRTTVVTDHSSVTVLTDLLRLLRLL